MKKKRNMNMTQAVPSYEKESRKSSASINLGDGIKLPRLPVGTKVTIELTGKLTRISDESYSKGFSMDVTSIETDSMGEDMGKSKRSRMMDMDEDDY